MNIFKRFFGDKKPVEKSPFYTESGKLHHPGGVLAIDILKNGQFILTEMRVKRFKMGHFRNPQQ